MTTPLDDAKIAEIQAFDAEKRYKYLVKEVVANREIWILIDEHGCVMLNTEDEDCVPVWPNKEFAEAWATGDWAECKAESISLNKWHSRWTHGLEDDELAVVIFPNQDEDGLVVFPDELDFELKQQVKKQR
ncbi:DUF2750 domain-containing protein [Photobacterium damselae]|uniref:DUF2750 domain-containing protein n=3 Tax=Photobacterium damselae TaxID=38293 RepID=D0Z4H0_PHODD|nr:DUF2750 domain-containing protein [Photobacterium damselae]EEZ39408.1 hypothetical protein VDA_000428 [Photobacterium damselae subsp. damselae CIP 102761]KAB1175051.1 DUF2750 domain-containing protein [Photobacterium damselae subsp. damselae]PSB78652.1 DUF2750 domain-containing protein [Photobacterium damselae subsp. damselae]PSU18888.1 DUF2750 domain-containing protein [Photobacterium damselae]PSW86556.1 DUF2750 domain-containing protein [Photobacterium damselae]